MFYFMGLYRGQWAGDLQKLGWFGHDTLEREIPSVRHTEFRFGPSKSSVASHVEAIFVSLSGHFLYRTVVRLDVINVQIKIKKR